MYDARFTAITIHMHLETLLPRLLTFRPASPSPPSDDRNVHHRQCTCTFLNIRQKDHPRANHCLLSRRRSQQSRNVFKVDCCPVENLVSPNSPTHTHTYTPLAFPYGERLLELALLPLAAFSLTLLRPLYRKHVSSASSRNDVDSLN